MRYVIILFLGALLGGGAAVFFMGAPRARSAPGVQVKAPDPKGDPPGTVVVSLDQGFVDAVLATTFSGWAHRRSISADSTQQTMTETHS